MLENLASDPIRPQSIPQAAPHLFRSWDSYPRYLKPLIAYRRCSSCKESIFRWIATFVPDAVNQQSAARDH